MPEFMTIVQAEYVCDILPHMNMRVSAVNASGLLVTGIPLNSVMMKAQIELAIKGS